MRLTKVKRLQPKQEKEKCIRHDHGLKIMKELKQKCDCDRIEMKTHQR